MIAPTIKSRFILLISLAVLFWFVCSLVLVDRINLILQFDTSRQEVTRLRYDLTRLSLETDRLSNRYNELSAGSLDGVNNDIIEEICISLNSAFSNLNSSKLISENLALQRNVKDASDNVAEIKNLAGEFVSLFYERGDLGSGLLKQWHSRLLSIKGIPRGSLSGKASAFLEKVSDYSDGYLLNRNPDELEKLLDFWQLERNLSVPENSAGYDTEVMLTDFFSLTKSLSANYRKAGKSMATGLQAELRFNQLQIDDITRNIEMESRILYEGFSKRMLSRFIWFVILGGILVLAVFYTTLNQTHLAVSRLKSFLHELKSGKVPAKLEIGTVDDLNEMANNLNEHVESLNRKIVFADQIGESNIQGDFKPEGEEDVLGNSLLKMATRLHEAELEDSLHKAEEEKRRWLSEGMASFGDIFRSERENLEDLAF